MKLNNLKKDQTLNVVLGALVVIALVLGFTLIKGEGGEKEKLTERLAPPSADSNSAQIIELTDEEEAVLRTPSPGAPVEERQRHFDLATQMAVSTNSLDLSTCKGDPLVLKASVDNEIKIINNDTVPHDMVFGLDERYTIPASGFAVLPNLFDRGPGLYGYGCDASPTAAGLFLVTE